MKIYTEKDFPIEIGWIIRVVWWRIVLALFSLLVVPVLIGFKNPSSDFIIGFSLYVIITALVFWIPTFIKILSYILRRNSFHYSFDATKIKLEQGVFKKESRYILYGVIQNILINRKIGDRIFGLAQLVMEDSTYSGGLTFSPNDWNKMHSANFIGFIGNRICVPGLSINNANKLKNLISDRIKENPTDDSQSGL